MADKTYLVRGYYPGEGFKYWYSPTPDNLFASYPVDYPTPIEAYESVVIYDIVATGSSGIAGDGYAVWDTTQISSFTGDVVAGEPLVLTPLGLDRARADTHDRVYGLAAESLSATEGATVIPVVLAGTCLMGGEGAPISWLVGDELYLSISVFSEGSLVGPGITKNIASLATTASTNIVKLGTYSGPNLITVAISFVSHTG